MEEKKKSAVTSKKTNNTPKKNTNTNNKSNVGNKKSTAKSNTTKKNTTGKKKAVKKIEVKLDSLKELEDTGEIKIPKNEEIEKKVIEEVNKENFVQPEIDVKAYDTLEENKETVEEIKEEIKPVSQAEFVEENIKEEVKDAKDYKTLKKNRLIDSGILIVVVGLFVLVLTAYLNNSINLSDKVVMDLVIVSLCVEVIGIILIFISAFRRN